MALGVIGGIGRPSGCFCETNPIARKPPARKGLQEKPNCGIERRVGLMVARGAGLLCLIRVHPCESVSHSRAVLPRDPLTSLYSTHGLKVDYDGVLFLLVVDDFAFDLFWQYLHSLVCGWLDRDWVSSDVSVNAFGFLVGAR